MSVPASQSRWSTLLARLRERGVLRVAASYLVIAWLLLQIGDVTLEPMGAPRWVMRALITLSIMGFPIAVLLAWFHELTPTGVTRDTAPAAIPRPAAGGIRRYADVAVIGVLALTVAYLLLRDTDWLAPDTGLRDASIAIMPFEYVGRDGDDAYLATGLSDELRGQLARVPSLRVISRNTSMAVEERSLSPSRVAELLRVAALVEGTVRRDARRLRVSVQLVDGREGSVLWSRDFDRDAGDLLQVQTEIARAVVDAVLPTFTAQGGQVPPTATSVVSAQDLFMLGRELERKGKETPEAYAKAQVLYEQAIAADSSYAAAHAALGRAIAFQHSDMAESDPEGLNRLVLPHLDRALALDRTLSEAYVTKGNLRRWQLQPGGDEMYRIAAELDPNSAPAQSNLVAFEYAQYRPDLTLQHALRGRELDPFDFGLHVKVISGLMQLGRVDELPAAVAWLNAIFGDEPSAARWGCLSRRTDGSYDAELACLLLALRRFPESDELIRQVADTCWELGDTVCASAWLEPPAAGGDESAVLYSMVDRRDVAGIRKVLQEALQEPIDYARGSLLTEVGFAVGLDDEALRIFEAAGIERATRDTAVLRRNAMVLLAQATVVRRGRGLEPSSGQQLDALLEWSGRPLAHGGRHYDFHLVRAEVLTAAGRIDEALAEIEAAGTAAEAPFEVRQVTDRPMGRFLARDPRLEPILQTIRDRQAAVRARVASTLKAEGIDPAELAAPPGAAALSVATGAQQK